MISRIHLVVLVGLVALLAGLAGTGTAWGQVPPPAAHCSLQISLDCSEIDQRVGKWGDDDVTLIVRGSTTVTDLDEDAFGWGQISYVFTAEISAAPAMELLVGARDVVFVAREIPFAWSGRSHTEHFDSQRGSITRNEVKHAVDEAETMRGLIFERDSLRLEIVAFAADFEGCTAVSVALIDSSTFLALENRETGKLETVCIEPEGECNLLIEFTDGGAESSVEEGIRAFVNVRVEEGRPECLPGFYTIRFGSVSFQFIDDQGKPRSAVAPIGGSTTPRFEESDRSVVAERGNFLEQAVQFEQVRFDMSLEGSQSTFGYGMFRKIRSFDDRLAEIRRILTDGDITIGVSARVTDKCNCQASTTKSLQP